MNDSPDQAAQVIVNKSVTEFSVRDPGRLRAFIGEVLRWNPQLGLISRRDPAAACQRLLLESLEIHRLVMAHAPKRLADVGSGAGFPGIVLAIQEPEWSFVLIERATRRASFLEATARVIKLSNVCVYNGSAEDAARDPDRARAIDAVTAIAVGPPERIGVACERFLRPGGYLVTTHPRGAMLPALVGTSLRLDKTTEGRYGLYAEYRFAV
jgi:16S rRNA (guanine527-N7)-methyltransferase